MHQPEKTVSKQLLFSGQQLLLVKHGDHYQVPAFAGWPEWARDIRHSHTIGSYNNYNCHTAEITVAVNPDENHVWMPLKSAIECIGVE